MEYRHLERIQSLMSLKSTTSYTTGHSTSKHRTDYQNAAAAMAMIKDRSEAGVWLVADVYCVECKSNYLTLRHELHKSMIRLLKKDSRKLDYALCIVDIGMGQVYGGKFKTLEECAKLLGMSRQSYSEAWRKYVDNVAELLRRNLFDADIVAGDYFYAERVSLDKPALNML